MGEFEMSEAKEEIIRRGERYVFAGGIPNTKHHKHVTKQLKKNAGRKVAFVDVNDAFSRVYISSKFHPETSTKSNPYHGTGTLRGEIK
jgi:hypothetical protein